MTNSNPLGCSLLALGLLLALSACSEEPVERPPVEVVVSAATETPYKPSTSYVGRMSAVSDIQIMAQVSGYIKTINFADGHKVEKGDLLIELESSEYEASLNTAKAEMT